MGCAPGLEWQREFSRVDTRAQAIMLVESVDGQSALLGRPRSLKRRGPVLTCLSGFIEQGESIEEAVQLCTSPDLCLPRRCAISTSLGPHFVEQCMHALHTHAHQWKGARL
jgi:hypothetical protein